MKISLRKAHRLVKDLQTKIASRPTGRVLHHTSDEAEVLKIVGEVETANAEAVETALRIVESISDIRSAVQALNAKDVDGNSIDSLLNRKVQIESKMKVLASFATPPKDTQDNRILSIKRQVLDSNKTINPYASDATVTGYNVETAHAFNAQYVELKKEQEEVSDKLAYINNLLQVEIDDVYKDLFTKLQVL